MKILLRFLFGIVLIACLFFGGKLLLEETPDLLGTSLSERSIKPKEDSSKAEKKLVGPYDVVRVIDGDTAMISIDGDDTRVRFIGIDTPESVSPDETKNTPEGKIASDYTKSLLTGKTVYLEYDVQLNDDYGRTLAYVYLDDGTTMVQTKLLEEGLATTMTIQPNSKYASSFHSTMVNARENNAGLWATGFFQNNN